MRTLALLLAPMAATPVQELPSAGRVEIAIERGIDGDLLCTTVAENVPVDRFVGELAARLSEESGSRRYVVEGFSSDLRAALVTIELRKRPVPQVLEYVLGSVGLEFVLRPGVISVLPASSDALAADALYDEAMLAYVRATRQFPDDPLAATARLSQGRLEEERGNLSAALGHYEAIRDSYRSSPLVPEAYWRTGLVLERMGNWAEANLAFRTLANSPTEHAYMAGSRREMARCANALGDPIRAMHILGALEETFPAQTREERIDRLLVNAGAQIDSGRAMDALRSMDGILQGKLTKDQRARVFALQARAFEGIGMLQEAAWAWQVHSGEVVGLERSAAMENAARLSLEAGEELNVLFLGELAAKDGEPERLAPYVAEAKARLGLPTGQAPPVDSPLDTLRRASQLLESDDAISASRLVEPLFASRAELAPEEAVLLYTTWARCLERRRGLDAAIRMLRGARENLTELDHRRRLDLCAAGLFEEYELFEQAVQAYEGRY